MLCGLLFGFYWVSLRSIGFYWILLDYKGSVGVSVGFTVVDFVLWFFLGGFTGF